MTILPERTVEIEIRSWKSEKYLILCDGLSPQALSRQDFSGRNAGVGCISLLRDLLTFGSAISPALAEAAYCLSPRTGNSLVANSSAILGHQWMERMIFLLSVAYFLMKLQPNGSGERTLLNLITELGILRRRERNKEGKDVKRSESKSITADPYFRIDKEWMFFKFFLSMCETPSQKLKQKVKSRLDSPSPQKRRYIKTSWTRRFLVCLFRMIQ